MLQFEKRGNTCVKRERGEQKRAEKERNAHPSPFQWKSLSERQKRKIGGKLSIGGKRRW